jgi:hypothetical protein
VLAEAGEGVEHRALADIGVAGQGDDILAGRGADPEFLAEGAGKIRFLHGYSPRVLNPGDSFIRAASTLRSAMVEPRTA